MNDRNKERPMFLAPDAIEVGVMPNGGLLVRLGNPPTELGFDPNLVMAMQLSPTEARTIGDLLIRKAREAEGGSSLN